MITIIIKVIITMFFKDPGLDILRSTSNLIGTSVSPPINPTTVSTTSFNPIISAAPVLVINNRTTQDIVVSPSKPIENYLTSIRLGKYSSQFVNNLEVTTVSDLEPLLQCKSVEELLDIIKGGGVTMKKIDASVLFSKLLSLGIE